MSEAKLCLDGKIVVSSREQIVEADKPKLVYAFLSHPAEAIAFVDALRDAVWPDWQAANKLNRSVREYGDRYERMKAELVAQFAKPNGEFPVKATIQYSGFWERWGNQCVRILEGQGLRVEIRP